MRNTARSHFVEVVFPAFESFAAHYANREIGLRRDTKNGAMLAEALRDLPEHVYADLEPVLSPTFKSSRQYRESFWLGLDAYEIVCDVANCWKHRKINRSGRTISSLDDVKEYIAFVRYEDHEGFYYGSRKMVTVSASGRDHELSALLSNSTRLWAEELVARSIIPRAPKLPQCEPIFHSREELRLLSKIRILGQTSERLEIQLAMMIFQVDLNAVRKVLPGEEFHNDFDVELEISTSPVDPNV